MAPQLLDELLDDDALLLLLDDDELLELELELLELLDELLLDSGQQQFGAKVLTWPI